MKRRTNLKAAAPPAPDKLAWDEVDRLINALAEDLMMSEVNTTPLMLLLQEISRHPTDLSHVESIANLLNMHLWARTYQADTAFKAFTDAERAKLAKGGEAAG